MENNIQNIDAVTLHEWVKSGNVLLIDVREINEFDEARIEGANNSPLSVFLPESCVPNNDSMKLVIYCRSGIRSLIACDIFYDAYPTIKPWNLEGGILSWQANGFEII